MRMMVWLGFSARAKATSMPLVTMVRLERSCKKRSDVKDRTARIEEHRVAVLDHVGRPASDPPLGLGVDLGTSCKGGADEAGFFRFDDCPATNACESSHLLQRCEIVADGALGDIKAAGKLGNLDS